MTRSDVINTLENSFTNRIRGKMNAPNLPFKLIYGNTHYGIRKEFIQKSMIYLFFVPNNSIGYCLQRDTKIKVSRSLSLRLQMVALHEILLKILFIGRVFVCKLYVQFALSLQFFQFTEIESMITTFELGCHSSL